MNSDEYRRMYEAEDRHWWYVSLHELILRFLPEQRQSMLDAGCGTGRLLQLLANHGKAEGCDVSPLALDFCRIRGLTTVTLCDLNTADLGADRYDLITSIDVLYHRGIKDEHHVVGKMHRALKPDGTLILHLPAYEWLRSRHDIAVHTGRRFRKSDVAQMLVGCGFDLLKTTYRVSILLLPIAAVRLMQQLAPLRAQDDRAASDLRAYPRVVNALLLNLLRAENRLLELVSLPLGTSIFIVAKKKSEMQPEG